MAVHQTAATVVDANVGRIGFKMAHPLGDLRQRIVDHYHMLSCRVAKVQDALTARFLAFVARIEMNKSTTPVI